MRPAPKTLRTLTAPAVLAAAIFAGACGASSATTSATSTTAAKPGQAGADRSVTAPASAPAARTDLLAVTQMTSLSGPTGIGLISPAGGRPTALTRHAGWADREPAWSPDAARIAFTRTTDGSRSFHVYVMRADGRSVRRITSGRFDERPAWSPDGRWIAYQSTSGIQLVHPDGSARRTVPGTAMASFPAWSPDGKRIAFSQGAYVITATPGGKARKRVVRGREPSWSPDGRKIAFTLPNGGVAVVAAGGGEARSLGTGLQPAWSPDGKRIAFTRWPPSLQFSVWVMNADGSGRRLVLRNADTPAWRP